MEAYRKTIAVQPKFIHAHTAIGNLHARNGEFAAAISKFKHVMELDSKNVWALHSWGLVCLMMREFDQAIEKFETIGRIAPKTNVNLLIHKAQVYRDRGNVP